MQTKNLFKNYKLEKIYIISFKFYDKVFVVFIAFFILKMMIYLAWKALIALLNFEKTFYIISIKYLNKSNIFLTKIKPQYYLNILILVMILLIYKMIYNKISFIYGFIYFFKFSIKVLILFI